MASTAESPAIQSAARAALDTSAGKGFASFVDHWMFVIMAGLFVLTALVGFVPSSIALLQQVDAAEHAPLHPVLHVHASLMGSWLLLLLLQSTLMATGRSAIHKRLGMVSLAYVPAIVVVGILLVKVTIDQAFPLPAVVPPAEALVIKNQAFSLVLYLIREGTLFGVLMSWALLARKQDPQLHKRLVILATVLVLTAAFARLSAVGIVPSFGLYNEAYWDICCLLWIAPMFLWDFYRSGKVHRAYRIWLMLFVVTAIPVHLLRETEWWNSIAAQMFGITG